MGREGPAIVVPVRDGGGGGGGDGGTSLARSAACPLAIQSHSVAWRATDRALLCDSNVSKVAMRRDGRLERDMAGDFLLPKALAAAPSLSSLQSGGGLETLSRARTLFDVIALHADATSE